MTSGFGNPTQPKANSSSNIQNFLETLRGSGARSGTSFGDENSPQKRNLFAEYQQKKEVENRRVEQFQAARSKEWAQVFSAKEKQVEKRVLEIREQLKKLITKLDRVESNVTQAIYTQPTESGEYYVSFYDHLLLVVQLMLKNANDANNWLELYNQRSAKKGHYWGAAKKSGTSFTQSNERAVATSIG